VAGRHKKIGNEQCPKCGRLGRRRRKTARNSPSGLYHYRYWFRHNDSSIGEHYVDNFLKRHNGEEGFLLMMEQYILKRLTDIVRIIERIKSFELTDKDLKRWNRGVKWFNDNFTSPLNAVADTTEDGEFKNSPECRRALVALARETWNSTENVFAESCKYGYKYLYDKYEGPKRQERNRLRIAKLSEWHGRRTDQFSGIESINRELKP
jgi:hypothetical protein